VEWLGFVDAQYAQAEKRWHGLVDELVKCDVEAAARLKTQLWAPAESEQRTQRGPPNWYDIDHQEDVAFKQYYKEEKICQHVSISPTAKTIQEGPQPKTAGDEVWKWQSQVLGKALDEWVKCDVEAAVRLKAQLWSP
jgi:hypothetical protein